MSPSPAPLLSPDTVRERLRALNGWTLDNAGTSLAKTFRFSDFSQAFGFMTRAALMAERLDHHPEWCNVYNRVDVRLSTHDVGGLTDKDFALAQTMEQIVADMIQPESSA